MARTVGNVITRARQAIGDVDGERADDPTCEGYVIDALNIALTERPDLFLGMYEDGIDSDLESSDPLPIDKQFFLPISAFVASMIESQDDQSSDRARGELMAKLGGSLL